MPVVTNSVPPKVSVRAGASAERITPPKLPIERLLFDPSFGVPLGSIEVISN